MKNKNEIKIETLWEVSSPANTYLSAQVEVGEKDGGQRARNDKNHENEEKEAKHVEHFVWPKTRLRVTLQWTTVETLLKLEQNVHNMWH